MEKKDYFVPLIKKVNWRVSSRQQGAHSSKDISKSEEELELDKEAAAAIMKGQFSHDMIREIESMIPLTQIDRLL